MPKRHRNEDEKPPRNFGITKHGGIKSKSEYNQLRQDLKAASRPNVKRKPSLPKLPWDDKEETE